MSAPAATLALPPVEAAGVALRRVAELAMIAEVGLGTWLVLAAAERRSPLSSTHQGRFTRWFAGPLHGLLPSASHHPSVLRADLHHLLVAMLVTWLVAVLGGGAVREGVVISAVVALNVVFLLCPAFALTDLFNYIGYARLDAVHHLNPYVRLPLAAPHDPVFAYSNWHGLRSPYGPLFTLLMLPLARLPLPAAYWVYKVLACAASLGLLGLIWACARRLGRSPAAAVAFVGLNPLVVVYALGGKHLEPLTMAALVGGGFLLLSRRELVGGVALAAAVAIQASAGLLAPVIACGTLRRGRAVLGLAAGGLALLGVSVWAFGPHLPDLHDQSRLVNAYSLPQLVGYATGHGGADAEVRRRFTILAGLGCAVCAGVAWRLRRWESPAGWAGLISLACVSWIMSWYVLWALPFAALSRSRVLRGATLVFSTWLVLIWAGTVPVYLRSHGYHPRATATYRANAHVTASLLHPCSLHLGKHRMLARFDGLAVRPAARHASARVAARRCLSRRGARARVARSKARPLDRQLPRRRPHRHAAAPRGNV